MIPTAKIECPVTEDNPQGFYIVNEEDVTPDMKRFVEEDKCAKMTVDQLKETLTAAGIDIPEGAKKAELVALCQAAG